MHWLAGNLIMQIEEFIKALTKEVPFANSFLKDHLEYYEEFLSYVYLEQLTDELIALYATDKEPLKQFLCFIENVLPYASKDLKILIATAVSETIDSFETNKIMHDILVSMCGNNLRSTLMPPET